MISLKNSIQKRILKILFILFIIWDREAGSSLSREPNVGGTQSQDPEIMTWAKGRHLTDWATQVPQKFKIILKLIIQFWTGF